MATSSRVMKKRRENEGGKPGKKPKNEEKQETKEGNSGEPNALKRRKIGEDREPVRDRSYLVELGAVAHREGCVRIVKEQDDLTDADVSGIQEGKGLTVHPGSAGESDEGRGIGADLDAGDAVDILCYECNGDHREEGEQRSSV